MSKVHISLNLQTKQWGVAASNLSSKHIDILFGFTRKPKAPPTEFNGLSFGVIVQKDGEVFYHNTFPRPGIEYKSTTSDIVEIYRIENLEKNSEYKMLFWVINNEVKYQHVYTLTTPNSEELTDYEVE